MFELYKKRDLNAYFSDTIAFFKTFGKHYFKNYFVINGVFLMVLAVLIYFISQIYTEALLPDATGRNNPFYFMNYFNNNFGLVIGGALVTFLLIIILSMLNITFPIIYLKLLEKNENADFTTSQIISGLKENAGKMIVFFLGCLFVLIPLAFIVFVILIMLCFILIGIPLIIIVGSAFMAWVALSYYEFIIKKVGFFTALSNGYGMVKQQFWAIVGTTFLMMLLIQTIQGVLTLIPYLFTIIGIFTSAENGNGIAAQAEMFSTLGIVMTVVMVLSVLMSYTFNNFILINQGLIYYSSQDEKENNSTKSQIDLIGTEIE